MPEQKNSILVSKYYDSTAQWRLTYFDTLKATPDDKLSFALKCVKEFAILEEHILNKLIFDANKIIELGCGVGRSIIHSMIAFPQKRFVGVDFAPIEIEFFKKQINNNNLKNSIAICSDVGNLPLCDNYFDLILICNQTFGNFLGKTRVDCFHEISRILKDNGKIMIGGYTNIELVEQFYKDWGVEIKNIDYSSGFIELANYNSYWQKEKDVNSEFEVYDFKCIESNYTTLGFVNIYIKMQMKR